MEKLFFIGIKHSGKTSIARGLAKYLLVEHNDTDDLILAKLNGETIREFYNRIGDNDFHKAEEKILQDFIKANNYPFTLSLGGGACENTSTLDLCKKEGKLILITRPEKLVLSKILENGIPSFLNENDLEGSFHSLYERRNDIYKKYCDIEIELDEYYPFEKTMEIVINELIEKGVLDGRK